MSTFVHLAEAVCRDVNRRYQRPERLVDDQVRDRRAQLVVAIQAEQISARRIFDGSDAFVLHDLEVRANLAVFVGITQIEQRLPVLGQVSRDKDQRPDLLRRGFRRWRS